MQVAVIALLSLWLNYAYTEQDKERATYKEKVCARVIYDFRGENPDCTVPNVSGARPY